jgi:two-component SAPR family response regulator
MTLQLAGKRVLIVEDEPMIAENLAFEFAQNGAQVIGPVASVKDALDLIGNTNLDGVTLDIKLMGEMAFSVADILTDRDIPFLFLTGYDAGAVPARHAHVYRVEKPVTPEAVRRALEATFAAHSKN